MADDDFELPVEPAETATEVEGEEPELDNEDDEGVTDPTGEPDVQDPEALERAPAKQISPASRAVMRAKAEAKAERERNATLQQEMMAMLRERHSPPPAQVDPRIEQERVALMNDREYADYRLTKLEAAMVAREQKLSLQMEVQNDKAAFQALVAADTRFKPYVGKVEDRFQALMKAGTPQTRESILKFVIGEAVVTKGAKALGKARETGQANIARETTRPSSARSNVSGDEARSGNDFDAAAKRLERYFAQGGSI